MVERPIPIIILGGSDRRRVRLPAEGQDKHPLSGYKGVDLRVGGRPVLAMVVERLEASGAFAPVYLAGPAEVYRPIETRAVVIDTNASFGRNIAAAMREVAARHPGSPVAFTTCDILPEVEHLRSVMADYARRAPCDLWFPLIRAPRDRTLLGASAWKPIYRVVPEPGRPPEEILPGHLLVTDVEALRLRFAKRVLDSGFSTRNRSILYRLVVGVGGLVGSIAVHDLLHVLGGRLPTLTRDTIGAGIVASMKLRKGRATIEDLERATRSIFIKREHRRMYPERRAALPILDGLSLALDIDTEEEAREREGTPRRSA
jgi:hypothetical protein